MIRRRLNLRGQDGWALVTALAAMSVMMIIGLTSLKLADANSSQSRQHREREASLNLAEGVLFAQTFTLARQWPGPLKSAFPALCTSAAATTGQCPNRQTLAAANSSSPSAAAFNDLDLLASTTWTTRVRDNYGGIANAYYTSLADGALTGALGTCSAPCSRDFNDDKAMWVQARSVVRGRVRNIVALMRMEQLNEAVPQTGLTAGAFRIDNNGNKPMIDASGSQVIVRCPPDSQLDQNAVCTNYRGGQVSPKPVQKSPGNLMDRGQIERFRDRAIIDGTYYASCPPTLQTGVVFIENCQNPPNYNTSNVALAPCTPPPGLWDSCLNTISKPGVLIVRCGALRLTGQWTFVGLMYFVNGSDGSCPGQERGTSPATCPSQSLDGNTVLDTQAGFGSWGGIAADGNACVIIGSNGGQMKFDVNAFSALHSYGTIGLVQNTWRELPAGTS